MIKPAPLIPATLIPAACRERGCAITAPPPDVFDAFAQPGRSLLHESDGQTDRLFIPEAWVMDVQRDIWAGDIKPWLERLHEEPAP